MTSYSINEINNILKGELIGNTSQRIEGPADLQKASSNQITFIGSNKFLKYWADSKACAALVHNKLDIEPGDNRAFIKVKNVDLAMVAILTLLIRLHLFLIRIFIQRP